MERRNKMVNRKSKKTNRATIVIALVACLLLLGGAIAWLTSTSELANTFTVGTINPVDPGGDGPVPGEDIVDDEKKLNGNLYEPSWVADSKLLPGATIAKDPYVGLGEGSEESYIFVNVVNTMANNDHIYFKLNAGWTAIAADEVEIDGTTYYTGGLFVYDGTLTGATSGNVWTTTPVFSNVIVDNKANAADFLDNQDNVGKIDVKSFIHQAKSGDSANTDLKATAVAAAKTQFGR